MLTVGYGAEHTRAHANVSIHINIFIRHNHVLCVPIVGVWSQLGMGLTMKVDEFIVVFQRMPALLLLGLALQYTVMPGLGYVFSRYVTPWVAHQYRMVYVCNKVTVSVPVKRACGGLLRCDGLHINAAWYKYRPRSNLHGNVW